MRVFNGLLSFLSLSRKCRKNVKAEMLSGFVGSTPTSSKEQEREEIMASNAALKVMCGYSRHAHELENKRFFTYFYEV